MHELPLLLRCMSRDIRLEGIECLLLRTTTKRARICLYEYKYERVHVSSLRIIRFGPAAVAFYPFNLLNVDLLSVSHSTI